MGPITPAASPHALRPALGRRIGIQSPLIGAAPWTPADIANLSVFLQFSAGNCYTDVARTTLATVGQMVKGVAPLFGTSISASEATNAPTLRAAGLEFDSAGVHQLLLSAGFTGGPLTIYTSQLAVSGTTLPILQSVVGLAMAGLSTGEGIAQDDAFGSTGSAMTVDAISLIRYSQASTGGDFTFNATGSVGSTGNALDAFTFDLIGGTGGAGYANTSTTNRFRLIIAILRNIALGSAEDLQIRAWIAENDGAAL